LSSAPESSPQRRGLGRGLEVLIGGQPVPSELLEIPVDAIHPNPRQPRRRFEPEAASGLAESVRQQGVIQPLLVRPRGVGGYEIVAGERRWRAAREAGRETVPAVVRTADDRDTLLLGLVENVAREDLSPVEEARGYALLIDEFDLSLGEVAERVGRSKPAVSNTMRLLELPDEVLELVARGELAEGHARAVLSAPDPAVQRRLARRAVDEGLSVRAIEKLAREAGARTKPRRKQHVDPELAKRVREGLRRLTGLETRVGKGKVELSFDDEHDLEELADILDRIR
jgi:ParB family chromosome partitioning protein